MVFVAISVKFTTFALLGGRLMVEATLLAMLDIKAVLTASDPALSVEPPDGTRENEKKISASPTGVTEGVCDEVDDCDTVELDVMLGVRDGDAVVLGVGDGVAELVTLAVFEMVGVGDEDEVSEGVVDGETDGVGVPDGETDGAGVALGMP